MGCFGYLAKVCVHLTSEDIDEIIDKYKAHLFSIISSKSTLKRVKDKAQKLHDTVGRSLQRAEVTSFFERLDKVDINATESLTNATESLTNTTEDLINANEDLYESKLKDDSYIENTDEDDCSSKCETIISEEDKQQAGEISLQGKAKVMVDGVGYLNDVSNYQRQIYTEAFEYMVQLLVKPNSPLQCWNISFVRSGPF